MEEENEIPEPVINLAKDVFGEETYKIVDWDMDRVYIEKNNEEFTIRMWNVTKHSIRWTLFKSVGNHGEEQKEGTFKY